METKTWTVRNKAGETVAKNIVCILEWLKINKNAYVLFRMESIKELVIA